MKGWFIFEFVILCICIYYSMYEVFLWQWVVLLSDVFVEILYLYLMKNFVLLLNVYIFVCVYVQNVNVFREMIFDSQDVCIY